MHNNSDETKLKIVKKLITNLEMKARSHRLTLKKEIKKILIVEGSTDYRFINKKSPLCDDVFCTIAKEIDPNFNYKELILSAVEGWPNFYPILMPKDLKNWKVFGMVDMDFDDVNKLKNTAKLFITDTHDLETLMLSTERDILQKIKGCKIEHKDVKKALFMAYQLGKMRQLFSSDEFLGEIPFKKGLSAKNGEEVEYSSFFNNDYQILLNDLISHLYTKANKAISTAKEKRLLRQLSKDKSIKNDLDKDKKDKEDKEEKWKWKSKLDSFDFDEPNPDDLWDVVNGHDILSLLRYVNEEAAITFKPSPQYETDRSFEIALIDAYDPENFKKTEICRQMREAGIVKA